MCINFKCYTYRQYLLSISERANNGSKDHAGAKASHKQHLNLVGSHPIAVIQCIDMGALQPVARWNTVLNFHLLQASQAAQLSHSP